MSDYLIYNTRGRVSVGSLKAYVWRECRLQRRNGTA
nr:MAG TPA: hypothetical protein [Caudoviricetes sp.]